MDQVIEHIQDPRVTLQQVRRILKPGGKFVLSTPHGDGLLQAIFKKSWIHWHSPYHLHYFSKDSLNVLFKDSGFQIEEIRQVTCAEWLFYQARNAIDFPKVGEPSHFWSPSTAKSTPREYFGKEMLTNIAAALRRMGFYRWTTRLLDFAGAGDNWIVVVVKTD